MITSISCVTRDGDQNLLHSSLTLGLKQRYVGRAVQIHLPCIPLTGKATGLLPCRMHGYGISRLPGFIALFLPDPRRVDPCDCDRPMGRNASHRHSSLGQIRATLRARICRAHRGKKGRRSRRIRECSAISASMSACIPDSRRKRRSVTSTLQIHRTTIGYSRCGGLPDREAKGSPQHCGSAPPGVFDRIEELCESGSFPSAQMSFLRGRRWWPPH